MLWLLFNAIEKLHPGAKVIDVRFSVSRPLPIIDIHDIDLGFANVILNNKEVDPSTLSL